MKRYELQCYMCKQTLGFISLAVSKDNTVEDIIKSTVYNDEHEPVCCPMCELRRLRCKENEQND